jgi:opacity protein-like surface antigen
MKRIIFLGIGILLANTINAQDIIIVPHRVVRRPVVVRQQDNNFYKARVGLTAGFNISNTVNAYNTNFSTAAIVGFNAGLTLDLPIIYPLSFAPEVLYSQKGYAASTDYGNFTQHSNYIDVPLLAKFRLSPSFSFLIGPQISFPISTTNTYDDGFQITEEDYYNHFDQKTILDGVAGVSFDLGRNFELRARYTLNLEPNNQNNDLYGDYRTQVWQFGLGVKF